MADLIDPHAEDPRNGTIPLISEFGGFFYARKSNHLVGAGDIIARMCVDHLRFGIIGAVVCLVVMVVVSLMTEEPDSATQKMVDEVRIPSGKTILGKAH